MTDVAQNVTRIERLRTTHKVLGALAAFAFVASVVSTLYFTLPSVIAGVALFVAAIVLKVFEARKKAEQKLEFEQGLETALKIYCKANGIQNGIRVKLRSKKRYKYFVNVYEPAYVHGLEECVKDYASKSDTRIKFKVQTLNLHDLIAEIFS